MIVRSYLQQYTEAVMLFTLSMTIFWGTGK